jgi:hypothetical protein
MFFAIQMSEHIKYFLIFILTEHRIHSISIYEQGVVV